MSRLLSRSLALGIALSLALAPASQARNRPGPRSCDIEEIAGGVILRAEEIGVANWHFSTSSKTMIHSFVWLSKSEEKAAYVAGKHTAGASDLIYVSPMKQIPKDGAWLSLRGNGVSVDPEYYGHHKHGRSAVTFGRDPFFRMAAGAEDIQMIVQAQDGQVLYDEWLPSARIREAEAGLVPLVRELDERMKDRENRCPEMIILVH